MIQKFHGQEIVAVEQVTNLHVGGKIDIYGELLNCRLVIENDNDPLPENYPTVANEECTYEEWGHSGICHRRQIVARNIEPSL